MRAVLLLLVVISAGEMSSGIDVSAAGQDQTQQERETLMELWQSTDGSLSSKQSCDGSLNTVIPLSQMDDYAEDDSGSNMKWISSHLWGSNEPLHKWFGVTTGSNGHVVKLELYSNNLNGTLTDLSQLTYLQELDLRDNHLRGTIPTSIGLLHSLTHLYVNKNTFSG
jgi:hypothetical protein